MFKSPTLRSAPHLRTQSNLCFIDSCLFQQTNPAKTSFETSIQHRLKKEQKQTKISLRKKNSIESKTTKKTETKLQSVASSPNVKNYQDLNMKRSQTSVFIIIPLKDSMQVKQKTLKKHHFPVNITRNMFPKRQITFYSQNNFNNVSLQSKQFQLKQKPFNLIQKQNQIHNLCQSKKKGSCLSPATPVSPQYQIQIHFQAQQQKWLQNLQKYQGDLSLIKSLSSKMFHSKYEQDQVKKMESSSYKQKGEFLTMQTLGLYSNQFRDTVSMNLQQSQKNESFESFVIGRNMS